MLSRNSINIGHRWGLISICVLALYSSSILAQTTVGGTIKPPPENTTGASPPPRPGDSTSTTSTTPPPRPGDSSNTTGTTPPPRPEDNQPGVGTTTGTTTSPTPGTTASPPPRPDEGQQPNATGTMTVAQTLSDEGQRNTIAFSGLSFLTGSLGADSFFPPGKVADFWGFQYMRDNDPSEKGHNTHFLTKAANNMLSVLNNSQKAKLIDLANSQVASINDYAYKRFPLMKAFRDGYWTRGFRR